MNLMYPELKSLIAEMSDGDEEFENQLTTAIYQGLNELKEKYLEASIKKNDDIIKQIRHKLKPTLSMFGFNDIIEELQNGKDILESTGFDQSFEAHKEVLFTFLEAAIGESKSLIK